MKFIAGEKILLGQNVTIRKDGKAYRTADGELPHFTAPTDYEKGDPIEFIISDA